MKPLTHAMLAALTYARKHGAVCAGRRHKARTLDALARRGLLVLQLSPDGGVMGALPPKRGSHISVQGPDLRKPKVTSKRRKTDIVRGHLSLVRDD